MRHRAYQAAAKAREVLNKLPKSVVVEASGSIIKNVKSVIVPNTGHLKGIPAAVAAGIVAGDADRKLEVISDVDDNKKCEIANFMDIQGNDALLDRFRERLDTLEFVWESRRNEIGKTLFKEFWNKE